MIVRRLCVALDDTIIPRIFEKLLSRNFHQIAAELYRAAQ
nr:MAG TPA: hypothetical protein [Bacteriophage sp.]